MFSPYIKIKRRSQPQWLIEFIVLYPFVFGLLLNFIGLPSFIKYFMDIAWLMLLFLAVVNFNRGNIAIEKSSTSLYVWVLIFFVLTIAVYLFRFQSSLYYLWGFRNNFRFYIVFFVFTLFLKMEDIKGIIDKFDVLFWINSVVCLFQYFVLGIDQDYLGGLFGTEKGCNGYLNNFFVIIIAKAIICYLNNHENSGLLFSKCGVALFIAALAELKFFYVEFICIIIVAVLITDFSWRKLWVITGGAVGVILAVNLLIFLFPYFIDFFSFEKIIESATKRGYSSQDALNRLTTIPRIMDEILINGIDRIFGLGLGNCDTASYDFLQTPFYIRYADIKYHWFSTSYLFLETGFLGLIFFFGFFVMIAIRSLMFVKNINDDNNKVYGQLSMIIAVMCILIGIYNSSLRTEAGYMMYFMLSFPFIAKKAVISDGQ